MYQIHKLFEEKKTQLLNFVGACTRVFQICSIESTHFLVQQRAIIDYWRS